MRPLLIVGAGGHGRETLDVVEALNVAHAVDPLFTVLGFVADAADDVLLARRGVARLGPTDDLARLLATHEAGYHLAVGSSEVRARLDAELAEATAAAGDGAGAPDHAVTLVHPAATQGSDVRLGPGVLLAAGARVTTNVVLGRHTHLNVNAVVSHDCVLGAHVTLSPGVLVNGNVTIGDGAFLGSGAIVLPGRRIGARAVIGAGAVITRDVPVGVTATGVPATWTR